MRWILIVLCLLVAVEAGANVGVSFSGGGRGTIAGGGGSGASCTDGVDCYCDTPAYTADPLRLVCQDFESPSLYTTTSPNPWYKAPSGNSGYRGGDSYWTNTYGSPGANWFTNGEPVGPYFGQACAFGVCGLKEFCSSAQGAGQADCWGPGANSQAAVDIQRAGDHDEELPLTLAGGRGSAPEVGAGNTHFAHRISPGGPVGILGSASLGGLRSQVGITFMTAYSSNFAERSTKDDPFDAQMKHEEWGTNADFGAIEHWYMGRLNVGDDERIPFRSYQLMTSTSACNSALSGATVHVGATPSCQGIALYYSPPTSGTQPYVQSRDFPWGTWGCVRAWRNVSGGFMETKIWFNEVLIFHISNFAASALRTPAYELFAWNSYANINEDGDGTANDTDEPFYRYLDNVHVRAGDPVSCATIGY